MDGPETEEVQKKIDAIKYKNVNPEEISYRACCVPGISSFMYLTFFIKWRGKGISTRESLPSF